MRADQSPFPAHWWGTEIKDVPDRPYVGTYGRYKFARLPRLPFEELRGDFHWLAGAPSHKSNIGEEKPGENQDALAALKSSVTQSGIGLPGPLVRFMETPALHQKIRSVTDCFLDLCPALVPSPIGDGWLLRFLADSQSCIFWYLFITAHGANHAVVASSGFYGAAEEDWNDEPPDPADLVFVEESFEAFLCRFWLENEIRFSQYHKTPMPDPAKKYLDAYRA